ncbi:phosphate-starvation-inducible PsiE family protein [uncultured Pseudodesulfovibrio sp.]|uniref:phosphate-starvation-inducible PsiE family protein n=1 Tax=uncultured Pseudodesulfovibrio sp. TaxID=2035858 RepID=UPI0029C9423B|nr:phosphate-starvation-inducible PsiE family protein [uncultured Pseudodesulfovibrio sp.]
MFFFDKELCKKPLDDPLIRKLWHLIRLSVRALAVLMTLVIIWGILDVIWVLYQRIMAPPVFLLNINDILATFGAFMAVLIAIEIFANIVIYLEYRMIHLKLVISTALMAAARKVIVLDFKEGEYGIGYALGAIIISLGISYWLVGQHDSRNKIEDEPVGPCNENIEDGLS